MKFSVLAMSLLVMSSWDNVIAVQILIVKLPLNVRFCYSYAVTAKLYDKEGFCGNFL